MKPEKLDAIAQGRVWTGRQAKSIGLVDELGGLDRAIAAAKQRAKIPAASDVEVVVYPPKRSFFELLSKGFKTERAASSRTCCRPTSGARWAWRWPRSGCSARTRRWR